MAVFDNIDQSLLRIGEDERPAGDVTPFITQLSVSLTMDASSEIQFTVIDKDFIFARNNYFQLRRNVYYRDLIFEISRVDVTQDQSSYPAYSISARSKNIQLMKRDKEPEAFSGLSPTEFASTIAARFNMSFFGQETAEARNIVKGASSRVDESTYDVLQRVAGENQFTVFETQNTLLFTSQEYLLGKWGDTDYLYQDKYVIPIEWPEPSESLFPGASSKYRLIEMPTVGKSDDDWKFAEGSFLIERINGVKLRPGMTIDLGGIPDFEGLYLITAVEFEEGTPDPVRVQFRSPNDPEAQRTSGTGGSGGGGDDRGGGGSNLPASIQSKISDYIQRYYPQPARTTSISQAEAYSNAILEVTSYTLGQATIIWNGATSATEVRNYIDTLRNAAKNIEYRRIPHRAINHVYQDLIAKFGTQQITIPRSLNIAIRNKYVSLIGYTIGNTTPQSLQDVIDVATDVWNKASVPQKDAAFDAALAKYGENSIQYKTLVPLRSQIIPGILDVFSGQYFPSVPI